MHSVGPGSDDNRPRELEYKSQGPLCENPGGRNAITLKDSWWRHKEFNLGLYLKIQVAL